LICVAVVPTNDNSNNNKLSDCYYNNSLLIALSKTAQVIVKICTRGEDPITSYCAIYICAF